MEVRRAYGALPNVDSVRVYAYDVLPKAKAVKNLAEITEYKIPEERMPQVLDQGEVGACVANACCSVLSVLNYAETGHWVDFSTGWFYGHHRSAYSNGYGMITGTAVDMCRKHGSVPETMFQEYEEMPEMKKLVAERPDLEAYAEPYRIKSFVKINYADKNKRWEAVKEAFLTYELPLVIDSSNYFGEPHCVMAYGFTENGKKGRELYFQNSWGEGYKDGGRSSIPFDEVDGIYLLLDETISLQFADVPEDIWYYKNVLHLYAAGLITGRDETHFDPDAPVSRAEVCAIVDRLMEKIEQKDDAMMRSVYDYVDRRAK